MKPKAGLRAIAAFEGLKGVLVLAAGCGAAALVHRDLQALAEEVVSHFHLNPASRFPRIFVDLASRTTDARLWAFAALAAAYAAVRLLEAYGLWNARRWAEWLGVLSGGFYVPVETYEIARHVTATRAVLLVGNLFVVVYLAGKLRERGLPRAGAASEGGSIPPERAGGLGGAAQQASRTGAASEGGSTPPERAGGLGGAAQHPPEKNQTSSTPGKK